MDAGTDSSDVDDGWASHESEGGLRTPVPNSDSDAGYASEPEMEPEVRSQQSNVEEPASEPVEADEGWVSADEAAEPAEPRRGRGRPRTDRSQIVVRPAVVDDAVAVKAPMPSDLVGWSRGDSRLFVMEGSMALAHDSKKVSESMLQCLAVADPPPLSTSTGAGLAQDFILKQHLETMNPMRGTSWAQEMRSAGLEDGTDRKVYQNRYYETAELVYGFSRVFLAGLATRIASCIAAKRYRGVLLVFFSQADEASSKLRVPYERISKECEALPAAPGHAEYPRAGQVVAVDQINETAKVVQSEVTVGMVLEDTETGKYEYVHTAVPCILQAVDRSTTETLHEVHRFGRSENNEPELSYAGFSYPSFRPALLQHTIQRVVVASA
jgi:hypothetical protein